MPREIKTMWFFRFTVKRAILFFRVFFWGCVECVYKHAKDKTYTVCLHKQNEKEYALEQTLDRMNAEWIDIEFEVFLFYIYIHCIYNGVAMIKKKNLVVGFCRTMRASELQQI